MTNRTLSALFILTLCITSIWASPRATSKGGMQIPLLRLKLVLNESNYDDIAIGFLSTATTQYNNQLDSKYLPGIDAKEGLSSFSSDNVPLSVNIVPLPGIAPLVIRLDVQARESGPFTLDRTELDAIPQVYDVWLMDKYAKDSLNLRTDTSYAFNVNKNDTSSFGSNRFTVVIRQTPALMLHLLGFSAKKGSAGNELTWTTANEQTSTIFAIERSIDDGTTFFKLDSLLSNGSGSYSYIDKSPMSGGNLYRLKMQDMNGVITYSNIVVVDDQTTVAAAESNTLSIYPNPSNGVINLAIRQNAGNSSSIRLSGIAGGSAAQLYDIKIINIAGLVIKSETSANANWQSNVSTLTPGTYIIRVVNDKDKSLVGEGTFVKM
jgi:hypothetical protein